MIEFINQTGKKSQSLTTPTILSRPWRPNGFSLLAWVFTRKRRRSITLKSSTEKVMGKCQRLFGRLQHKVDNALEEVC